MSKLSPDFDISNAGDLKIPDSQAMPYEKCLRLHFHFCLRMNLCSPPRGTPLYSLKDVEDLQDEVGLFEPDEALPELSDPIWNSPLGQEVLRSAMAQKCAYQTLFVVEYTSSLIIAPKYPLSANVMDTALGNICVVGINTLFLI